MHVCEWDLVAYGVKHAKRGTKARGRVPWRYHTGRVGVPGVTLQEVIEEARRLYPDLSIKPATARKWIERSLLPNPTVEARGGRQGNRAHYPDDSPAQMAVAAHLQDSGFTQRQIAQARRIVLEGVPVDDVIPLEDGRLHDTAITMVRAVRTYASALAQARAGGMLDSSTMPGSIEHKWELSPHTTPSGKILYHCPVCGLYDPAPVKPKFENRACVAGKYADRWEAVPREDGNGCIVRVR